MEFNFLVKPGGRLVAIYNDALSEFLLLGEGINIRRASNVEPTPSGKWIADMSPAVKQFNLECDNPILGPFDLRGDALTAEQHWLEERLFR